MITEKEICPRCHAKLTAGKRARNHIERCLQLPTSEELVKMFNEDETMTLTRLVKEYKVHIARLRDIVLASESDWTAERLAERGRVIKYEGQTGRPRPNRKKMLRKEGRFECKAGCGMLIAKPGKLCQFCLQEKKGLRSHLDFMRMGQDDPRWKLVRSHPQKPA